jgi:Bacterial SH3 domain
MKITANFPLAKQTGILQDEVTPIAEAKPTYQLAQTAQLQITPNAGATVVRSLSAKTPVTVLESKNGWSLVAAEGKPIGYVATRDLAPVQ